MLIHLILEYDTNFTIISVPSMRLYTYIFMPLILLTITHFKVLHKHYNEPTTSIGINTSYNYDSSYISITSNSNPNTFLFKITTAIHFSIIRIMLVLLTGFGVFFSVHYVVRVDLFFNGSSCIFLKSMLSS